MVLEGARGSVRSPAGMSPRSKTRRTDGPAARGLLGGHASVTLRHAERRRGHRRPGPDRRRPSSALLVFEGTRPQAGRFQRRQRVTLAVCSPRPKVVVGRDGGPGQLSDQGTANMMHSAKEHDDDQHACCGPAPQSGGSCCGGPVESAASSPGSECCDPTSREAGSDRRQSSCCGAPAVPPAEYPYGAAEYVTGTVETPVGAVPRVSRTLVRRDRVGTWRVRWGVGRDDYRVKPGVYAVGTPGAGAPVLVTANYKLTFDAAPVVARGARCLAPGHRHARHQRLVRGRQGHVLRG